MTTPPTNLRQPGQPDPRMEPAFKRGSFPAITTFSFTSVAPPSPLYIQRDDILAVDVISDSVTEIVTVNGRLLLAPVVRAGQPGMPAPPEMARLLQASNIISPIGISVDK